MKIERHRIQSVFDEIIEQGASQEGLSEEFLSGDAVRIIASKFLNKSTPYATGEYARNALTMATTVNGGMTVWGYVGEVLIVGIHSEAGRNTNAVVKRDNKATHDLRCAKGRRVSLSEAKLATLTRVNSRTLVAQMNASRAQLESNSNFIAALVSLDSSPMTTRYIVCPMSVIRACWENSGQSKNDRYGLRVYFDNDGNIAGNGKIAKALAPYVFTGADVVEAVRKLVFSRNS